MEEELGGEAVDGDVSVADGLKESGVGRGTKRARDIGSEGSVYEVRDRKDGGVDGESGDKRDRIGEVRVIGGLGWRSGGLKGGMECGVATRSR
jgi:hypothetical protein